MGEKLSAWVDAHLQPLIELTPSYIKDTKELVRILDGQFWGTNFCWVLCDVVALYPSMLHLKIIETINNTEPSIKNIYIRCYM